MHVRPISSLQVSGSLVGAGLQGTFHTWSSGGRYRSDQQIGVRTQRVVRSADGLYVLDDDGSVRTLRGLLAKRRATEEFIGSDGFMSEPKYDTFDGPLQLPDGRAAYGITVAPPNGLPETIALDAKSWMIDRISYQDNDGVATTDFYDYRVFAGALLAQREIESNGDRAYDLGRFVRRVIVDRPIAPAVFDAPQNTVIQTDAPVTVPLQEHDGHYYVQVRIHGRPLWFLVDTGSQGIVLDSGAAQALGLNTEGRLEVSGAQRTGGMGMAQLDALQIGAATLPLHVVTVLNLHDVTGSFPADGVLGYPFFAAAEVTFDAKGRSMTIGKPGTLKNTGTPLPVDADRELVEFDGKVNGVDGRFVLDTGDAAELLLFAPFMDAHRGLISPGSRHFADSYGVGGSVRALTATVDELDIGSFRFFNRYANLMLSKQGAFADRFDAGNVGMGVLRNLIVTFDLSRGMVYLAQAPGFDDGRFRARTDPLNIP